MGDERVPILLRGDYNKSAFSFALNCWNVSVGQQGRQAEIRE
jgi:hypothetical protein